MKEKRKIQTKGLWWLPTRQFSFTIDQDETTLRNVSKQLTSNWDNDTKKRSTKRFEYMYSQGVGNPEHGNSVMICFDILPSKTNHTTIRGTYENKFNFILGLYYVFIALIAGGAYFAAIENNMPVWIAFLPLPVFFLIYLHSLRVRDVGLSKMYEVFSNIENL